MPKPRTRAPGAELKPPGKWSHEATLEFYHRHGCSINKLADVVATWPNIGDPKAFAAQIADYVRQSTMYRNKQVDLFPEFCAGCGARSDETRLTQFKENYYCDKCYVTRRYEV